MLRGKTRSRCGRWPANCEGRTLMPTLGIYQASCSIVLRSSSLELPRGLGCGTWQSWLSAWAPSVWRCCCPRSAWEGRRVTRSHCRGPSLRHGRTPRRDYRPPPRRLPRCPLRLTVDCKEEVFDANFNALVHLVDPASVWAGVPLRSGTALAGAGPSGDGDPTGSRTSGGGRPGAGGGLSEAVAAVAGAA